MSSSTVVSSPTKSPTPPTPSTNPSPFRNLMNQIDHIGNRVTTCTITGLCLGASTATYKALPLFQTSTSIAASFALTSTACCVPERLIYHASFYVLERQQQPESVQPVQPVKPVTQQQLPQKNSAIRNVDDIRLSSFYENPIERRRLIASHIGGGIIGGTISGSLFQRRFSWTGMLVFTPIMVGVAYTELYLQRYRRQRLQELYTR